MSIVLPHDSTARTFKACRSCRSQKSKCRGEPGAPCDRCKSTGRDCVFDLLGSKRAQEVSVAEPSKKSRSERLENEVDELRHHVDILLSKLEGRSANVILSSPHARALPREPRSPARPMNDSGRTNELEELTSAEGPNLLQLENPITSKHAMTGGLDSPPETPSTVANSSPYSTSDSMPLSSHKPFDDIVSRRTIEESKARQLYHLYMAHANVSLPLFDSVVDTFDMLRKTSTFCFTAVLAIAMRVDQHTLESTALSKTIWDEASRLAAESLFTVHSDLRQVQGMLLLASYTEKNWFAIKHARQLAEDLGLNECLLELGSYQQQNYANQRIKGSQLRNLISAVRTWLVLHHVEREVIDGSNRQAVLKHVNYEVLRSILGTPIASASDIRIASTVEIVQQRGQFLRDLRSTNGHDEPLGITIQEFQEKVDDWFEYWSSIYEEHGLVETSFQRSSLLIQKQYAMIIASSAAISKLGRRREGNTVANCSIDGMDTLIETTVELIIKQLRLICENNAYRWNIAWAPVYSALMLAWITALALRLARHRPHLIDSAMLNEAATTVIGILDVYPHPKYASLLRKLTKGMLRESQSTSPAIAGVRHTSQNPDVTVRAAARNYPLHIVEGQNHLTRAHIASSNESASYLSGPWSTQSHSAFNGQPYAASSMTYTDDEWASGAQTEVALATNWDNQFFDGNMDLPLSTMFNFNDFAASMGT